MAHVRKQVRDAVIRRLETVTGIAEAHPESRAVRAFQQNEFPVALVSVAESASREDKNPEGMRTLRRSLSVSIRIAVRDDAESAEDILDECAVGVEKTLALSSNLGVGSLVGWAYAGTSDIRPFAVSDGTLLSVILSYTCDVLTLDVAPDANLYA